jgi:hypothetical protein
MFIQVFGDPKTHQVAVPVGFWFHDRWKPRPTVMVDIGLRYDTQEVPAAVLQNAVQLCATDG